MTDLPTLEARVREARADAIAEYHEGMTTEREVDELIAAAEALGAAKERQRCREAVEPLIGKFNSTYDHGVSDALDALEDK